MQCPKLNTHLEEGKKVKLSPVCLNWDNLYVNHISSIEGDHQNLENLIFDVFMDSCGFDDLHQHPLKDDIALRLRNFIQRVRYLYHDVPYHSFVHCAHVFLSVAVMLHHIQTSDKKFNDTQHAPIFTKVECISLLVSALVHDADHYGVFNSTLVKEGHEFSKMYNDQSVAENRSIAVALMKLANIDNNFIDLMLDPADAILFRKLVVEIVLSTDVADADRKAIFDAKVVSLFKQIDATIRTIDDIKNISEGATSSSSGLGLEAGIQGNDEQRSRYAQMVRDPKSRTTILTMIMQLSDIASSNQGIAGMKIWVARFIDEQMLAFKKGRKQGAVEIDSFFAGQKVFLSATTELINLLKYTEVCSDGWIRVLTTNIEENLTYWNEFGETDTGRWLARY